MPAVGIGVNFILPMVAPDGQAGLHAFGFGEGGAMYVFIFIALNLMFLAAASLRYMLETSTSVVPVEHTPEIFQAEVATPDAPA